MFFLEKLIFVGRISEPVKFSWLNVMPHCGDPGQKSCVLDGKLAELILGPVRTATEDGRGA